MGGDSNRRAQTTVLGAILVFGILVSSLGIFQVYVVPNQNADAELAHQNLVEEDFTRFHSGLMNAAAQNSEYTASFRLGMEYPARLVAVNPPNPQGTLSTSSIGPYDDNIDINGNGTDEQLADICGIDPSTETKNLRYTPDYNEVRNVPENGYENTITYRALSGTSSSFVEYDQQLLDGSVLRLRPLIGGSVSVSSAGTESIDFYAGRLGVASINESEDITLPTQLSEERWEEIAANGKLEIKDYDASDNTVTFNLKTDFTVRCTPIGVNEPLENEPLFTPNDGAGEGDYLNPVGPGALELESVTSSDPYELTYLSNSEPHNVTKIRVAAASDPGNIGKKIQLARNGDAEVLTIGGGFESVNSSDWGWGENETGSVVELTTKNPGGGGGGNWLGSSPNTQLTVQFEFEDGTIASYRIALGSS